jgi:TIGR03009 family protein
MLRPSIFLALAFVSLSEIAVGQQDAANDTRLTNQSLESQRQRVEQEKSTLKQAQQANAPAARQNDEPNLPPGFPLPKDHSDYVIALLEAWEKSSSQISRCVVEFQRIEYNPAVCNYRDPKTGQLAGASVVQGEVRFQGPDKASYESLKFWDFAGPPPKDGDDPQYKLRDDEQLAHEKWICDGESIFEYDFKEKRLYETKIPAEFRGEGLVNSPLPFVFGAKKEVLLERYWIKVITPQGVDNEYWLEIYPKRISDAQDYQKIQLVITQEDLLPRSIHIFAPNYDEVQNPVSRHIEFANRRINGQIPAIATFLNLFIRPRTPFGWELIDRDIPRVGDNDQAPAKVERK